MSTIKMLVYSVAKKTFPKLRKTFYSLNTPGWWLNCYFVNQIVIIIVN